MVGKAVNETSVFISNLSQFYVYVCVCLKSITLRNCLSSSPFLHHFSRITRNLEQENVAINGNFSGRLFFFWIGHSEGDIPRDFLINAATCLFAYD